MVMYRFKCSHRDHGDSGFEFDEFRSINERDDPADCPWNIHSGTATAPHLDTYTRRLPLASVALQPNGSSGDGYFEHRNKDGSVARGNAKMAGRSRGRWV